MRFLIAMPYPQVTPPGSRDMITVLYIVPGLVRTCCAEIDRKHRLNSCHTAPIDELIRSKLVSLFAQPGQVETRRALFDRAYPVFPIVSRKKISPWISYNCRPQFADEVQHIVSESIFVSGRMSRFEDAGINATPHMFDE